jgi:signal transduction histidine kinase
MNPLSRLLALGLLVLLAALALVLAVPTWRSATTPASPPATSTEASKPAKTSPVRLVAFTERIALPLALTALVLATALWVSLSWRPTGRDATRRPFSAERSEIGALTNLAEKAAAQGEALTRERRNRQRAEEDASLNRQLLDRSLEERTKLGRDLHDGLIQSLYAAGLGIESARVVAKTDAAEADRRLEQARETLNRAIRDVRTHIAGLAPESLREATFAQAVDALVGELGAGHAVGFDLHIDEAATVKLNADQQIEALQIVREAISNGLRHGRATQVTVRVHLGDGEVGLLVQDNGSGYDSSRVSGSGHGLRNMQARAERVGGSARSESKPGNGTRVVVTLPIRSLS